MDSSLVVVLSSCSGGGGCLLVVVLDGGDIFLSMTAHTKATIGQITFINNDDEEVS